MLIGVNALLSLSLAMKPHLFSLVDIGFKIFGFQIKTRSETFKLVRSIVEKKMQILIDADK